MLFNRVFSIFCLLAGIFIVVGFILASADPQGERSEKWAAIMFGARWILLVVFMVLFVLWLILK